MNSKSQKLHAVLEALEAAIERRRLAEDEERALKNRVRATMGEDPILTCLDYTVVRSDRKRVDYDRERLKAVLGERITEVQRETAYSTLELRRRQ